MNQTTEKDFLNIKLFFVYFIIIVVYAGISTSFAFIWLFFAALLVFLVYGKWYYARNMERIPRWVQERSLRLATPLA